MNYLVVAWFIGYFITAGMLVRAASSYTTIERHEAFITCFLLVLWPLAWVFSLYYKIKDTFFDIKRDSV